ncbi:hypothetical protein TNCV_877081 [Trichonephila clavipes]|nr:hypothetical protein TNCV_877081 [Trichonephila clavipes]
MEAMEMLKDKNWAILNENPSWVPEAPRESAAVYFRPLTGHDCDQGYTPEIMDEILTTARDLELEVNEDDIEQLIMGHEDELTTEELLEILNAEHQETQ